MVEWDYDSPLYEYDAIIYCDGGCFPNPGKKVIAFVMRVFVNDATISDTFVLGDGTNNEAEYEAVIEAMERAKRLNLKRIKIKSDSMLVINQLNFKWEVYEERLIELKKRAIDLIRQFEKVDFEWVSSNANLAHDLIMEKISGG